MDIKKLSARTLFSFFLLLSFHSKSYCYPIYQPIFSPVIAQFFGIWGTNQTWTDKFREDTPFQLLNRLYLAFAQIDMTSDGHFTISFDGPTDNVEDIFQRMKQVNPTAEIFLTLSGEGTSQSFLGAAQDPEFPVNVLNFLTENNFDGLDLDWEEGIDRDILSKLVENLYPVLNKNGLKLTVDVFPDYNPGMYNMTVFAKNTDQINIMSYGTSSNLNDCVRGYEAAGFPKNKIIGGIETETGYPDIDTLGPQGSIAEKANYSLNGMAGMMEWRLDNDYAPSNNMSYPSYKGAYTLWEYMTTSTTTP